MGGLAPKIAQHCLKAKHDVKLVKEQGKIEM